MLCLCIHGFTWFVSESSNVLKVEDLEILLELCMGIVSKWKDLGSCLGFSPSHLTIIECNPKLERPHGYLKEVFNQWLKWAPPSHHYPTSEKLALALNQIDEKKIALDLRDRVMQQKKGKFLLPLTARSTVTTNSVLNMPTLQW